MSSLLSVMLTGLFLGSSTVLGGVIGNVEAAAMLQRRSVAENSIVPGLAEFPVEAIVCKADGAIFTKKDIFDAVAMGVPDHNYIDPSAYKAYVVNDKYEKVHLVYRYTNLPGSVRIYEAVHGKSGECDVFPGSMKVQPDGLHAGVGDVSAEDHDPSTEEHSDNIAQPSDDDESS